MRVSAPPTPNRTAPRAHQTQSWKHEFGDIVRGASGGFLLGTPLLYTAEVWWIGVIATPPRMLLALAVTFTVVLLLTRTADFRQTKDTR